MLARCWRSRSAGGDGSACLASDDTVSCYTSAKYDRVGVFETQPEHELVNLIMNCSFFIATPSSKQEVNVPVSVPDHQQL